MIDQKTAKISIHSLIYPSVRPPARPPAPPNHPRIQPILVIYNLIKIKPLSIIASVICFLEETGEANSPKINRAMTLDSRNIAIATDMGGYAILNFNSKTNFFYVY